MRKVRSAALICLLALGCCIAAGALAEDGTVSYDQYLASVYVQDFDDFEIDMPFLYRSLAENRNAGAGQPDWETEWDKAACARAEMLLYCILYERIGTPAFQTAAQVRAEVLQAALLGKVTPELLGPEELSLPFEEFDPAFLEACLEAVAGSEELEVLLSAIWGCEIDLGLAGDLYGYVRLLSYLEALPLYDDGLCALLYDIYEVSPDSCLGQAAYNLEFTIESLRLEDGIFQRTCAQGDCLEDVFSGSMELVWQALLESWEEDGIGFDGLPAQGSEAIEWLAAANADEMRRDLQILCGIEDIIKQKVIEDAGAYDSQADHAAARCFCLKVDFLMQVRQFGMRLLSLDAEAMERDAALRESMFCFPDERFDAFSEDLAAFCEDFTAAAVQETLSNYNRFLACCAEGWDGMGEGFLEPAELPGIPVGQVRGRMRQTAARWSWAVLEISRSRAFLTVGGSFSLHVDTVPEGLPVTWGSSDETVASVDADGCVTARASGSAEVSAVCGNGLSAVCQITVLGDAAGDVNGDKRLDETDLQILLGQSAEEAAQAETGPEGVSAADLAALARLLYGESQPGSGTTVSLGDAVEEEEGIFAVPVLSERGETVSAVVAAVQYDTEKLALEGFRVEEAASGTACVRQGSGRVVFAWYRAGAGLPGQPLTLRFRAKDREFSGLAEVALFCSAAGSDGEAVFDGKVTVPVGFFSGQVQIDRVEFENGWLSCRVLSTGGLAGTGSQLLAVFSKDGIVTGHWTGKAVLSQSNTFLITGEAPEYDCLQLFLVAADEWTPISETVTVTDFD